MENTFLKWAGGKNWFVRNQNHRLPQNYGTYIDPFLGGGSLFFHMEPPAAILSDVNRELITTYIAIRDDWENVQRNLRIHARNHSPNYYYKIRTKSTRTNATTAARMIYLNRTCFNGIYRVNRNGGFNVPIGTHNNVILETDRFEQRSALLQNAVIECRDFEVSINLAQAGDFLFCDPPYSVLDENHRFVGYTGQLFNWNDQIRLAAALRRAMNRGVLILMTNVNHPEVRALYENINGFHLESVDRYSSISGLGSGRQQYSELIITANY